MVVINAANTAFMKQKSGKEVFVPYFLMRIEIK